jgi:TetR/AcrR family transcriptional regulator
VKKQQRKQASGSDDTRSRILAASLESFADEGFAGTTTRKIAARAKVNLGLIKYYFGSKEALWRAAVDEVFGKLAAELGAVDPKALSEPAAIRGLIDRAVRFAARNPAFIRLMNDECKRNSARMRWLVDRHSRRLYDSVAAIFGPLRREGLIPDVDDVHLYYSFIGALGMMFSQAPECRRLTGADPTSDDALIAAQADAITKLFLR